eukprot:scaffold9052_cov107-Isochrysis_galbana.AAC.1
MGEQGGRCERQQRERAPRQHAHAHVELGRLGKMGSAVFPEAVVAHLNEQAEPAAQPVQRGHSVNRSLHRCMQRPDDTHRCHVQHAAEQQHKRARQKCPGEACQAGAASASPRHLEPVPSPGGQHAGPVANRPSRNRFRCRPPYGMTE